MIVTATHRAKDNWKRLGEELSSRDVCGVIKRHLMPALKCGVKKDKSGKFHIRIRRNIYASLIPDMGRWIVVDVYTKKDKIA